VKRRHAIMLLALMAAGYLAIWGNEPAPPAQAATLPPSTRRVPAKVTTAGAAPATVAALVPRAALMQEPASDAATDPFSTRQPPAPPPPVASKPLPPPPPVAPPLPFQFLGKKLEDGRWEIYLDAAEQTLIAHQGDTLLGRYRVDEIRPPNLQLTYLPLNQPQTLAIGQGEE